MPNFVLFMKKIILSILMSVTILSSLQAKLFDTEAKTISLSAGFDSRNGDVPVGFKSRYGGIPVVISFEHNLYNINDDNGIRVGGIVGWSTFADDCYSMYDDNGVAEYVYGENRYHNISMAFKCSYFYTGFTKWDLYAGVMSGCNIQTKITNWDIQSYKDESGNKSTPNRQFLLGAFVGVRYEFTENIGAFIEGGYGLSFLSMGVSYRFRKQFFGQN